MTVIVIVELPDAPGATVMPSVQAWVLLPQPGDTARLALGTNVVLLLTALSAKGPVPVTRKVTGEAAPAPAVYSWFAPALMLSVGPAGFVTVMIIVAGAARLAPSSADTVTLAVPTWPIAGVTHRVQAKIVVPQ